MGDPNAPPLDSGSLLDLLEKRRAVLADPGLTGTDGAEAVAWARRAVRSNRRHPSLPPLA